MFKRKGLAVLAVFIFSLLCLKAYATEALPVPSYSEEVKKERRLIGGQAAEFSYYTSGLDAEQIIAFYRSALKRSGWNEVQPLKTLEQTPGFKANKELKSFFNYNLSFEKGDGLAIINVIPASISGQKNTRFTVAMMKQRPQAAASPSGSGMDFFPKLLDKPQKDVAPEYPGASLMNLSEGKDSLRATYFTPDEIENTIDFYREKMADYGWIAVGETPLETKEFTAPLGSTASECPTCPKIAGLNAGAPAGQKMAMLSFKDSKGYYCNLIFHRVIPQETTLKNATVTTITVDYGKAKF